MDRRDFLAAAAAPFVLGFAPGALGRSLGGGTPLALVTADLEAAIVAVDLDTGRVHRRLATPAGPRSIESVGDGRALVAHTGRGEVTVVDAKTLSVRPVEGPFGAPRYAAAHPEGRLAYVTDSEHVTFLGDRAFVTSGDDAVLRVHALDGRLLRSAPVPAGSFNVQQGGNYVLTPSLSEGTLCIVTPRGVPVEELRVARSSHDACFVMRR